jgi:hypothetical protein
MRWFAGAWSRGGAMGGPPVKGLGGGGEAGLRLAMRDGESPSGSVGARYNQWTQLGYHRHGHTVLYENLPTAGQFNAEMDRDCFRKKLCTVVPAVC